MITKEVYVRARVDREMKEEANSIFNSLGLTTSEAIRLFIKHVCLTKELPFKVKIPKK